MYNFKANSNLTFFSSGVDILKTEYCQNGDLEIWQNPHQVDKGVSVLVACHG